MHTANSRQSCHLESSIQAIFTLFCSQSFQFNSGYFGAKSGLVTLYCLEKLGTIFYPFRKASNILSLEVTIETVDKCFVE